MTQNPEDSHQVFRSFSGASIAALLATGAYSLTHSIAMTFAAKPIHSDNITAIKISIAVRTLVVGICSLATFVFAIATLGLIALGIQTLLQKSSSNN
jgi:predicted neutral ceramidase superfamily lipid hydrolase